MVSGNVTDPEPEEHCVVSRRRFPGEEVRKRKPAAAGYMIRDSLPLWLAWTAAGALTGGLLTTMLRRRLRTA